MRARALCTALACLALAAQGTEGRLTYEASGRRVDFTVVGAGHRALVTLAPGPGPGDGKEARARLFVLTHTGPERLVVPGAEVLKEKAPAAWTVSHRADRRLLRTPEATFWCYTPGLVLPVRFRIDGEPWRLVSAELPPKMFVSTPE
ncbi:MAG: hypothetical protein IPL96_00575 [Holophagaceae bacterium]|nr:hypothetical protein [Holophagaceae bacterium]